MEVKREDFSRGAHIGGWRATMLFGALFYIATASMAPAQQAVDIEHLPIPSAEENVAVQVEARLSAPGRSVVYARVYFKTLAQQNFRYVDMRPAANGYAATIPGSAIKPPLVQYFILILLTDQAVVTYPARNPYGQPFEIIVNERQKEKLTPSLPTTKPAVGGQQTAPTTKPSPETQQATPQIMDKLQRLETQPALTQHADTRQGEAAKTETTITAGESSILVLSPEPFASLPASEVVIAASFLHETPIDSASIRVILGREDITNQGEVSPLLVSITPRNLSPGEHRVAITARDVKGKILAPLSWRFSVLAEEDVPITSRRSFATGLVFAESRREKFSGNKLDNDNFGGNLSGGYGAIGYSGQLYITSLEDAAFQPRNRFSFSAGTPWLSFSVGDINPRFDELILWGQRVRGFSTALRLGSIFNVDFVTGATLRKVASKYDSTAGRYTRFGTFERKLLGVRPSFGGGRNFQWGFTLLKVRDQVGSLKADTSSVTPRDNLVVGSDLLVAFDSHRFELKASVAASLLSKDITNGPVSKDSIAAEFDVELPFDPASFEKYFIINESTIPLDPTGASSLAYNLTLRLNYFNNYLQLGYKRIGGEYFSLGNSFLRNDVRGFFAYDRLRLFRNRVYVNLGLERYDDHFSEIDDTPKIDLNTVSYGLSFFWGQNLPALNFSVRNYRRDNNIDALVDSTQDNREDALTRDVNLSINYDVALFNLNHTLSLNLMSSNRDDQFGSQRLAGVPPGDLNSNVKLVNLRTRYNFPLTSTLTFATNSSNVAGGQSNFKYNLFAGRGEYAMLREKLKVYGGLRLVSASGVSVINDSTESVVDYQQTAFQFGGSFQPAAAHLFAVDFDFINFDNRGGTRDATTKTFTSTNPSYHDRVIRAHYEFRF